MRLRSEVRSNSCSWCDSRSPIYSLSTVYGSRAPQYIICWAVKGSSWARGYYSETNSHRFPPRVSPNWPYSNGLEIEIDFSDGDYRRKSHSSSHRPSAGQSLHLAGAVIGMIGAVRVILVMRQISYVSGRTDTHASANLRSG